MLVFSQFILKYDAKGPVMCRLVIGVDAECQILKYQQTTLVSWIKSNGLNIRGVFVGSLSFNDKIYYCFFFWSLISPDFLEFFLCFCSS